MPGERLRERVRTARLQPYRGDSIYFLFVLPRPRGPAASDFACHVESDYPRNSSPSVRERRSRKSISKRAVKYGLLTTLAESGRLPLCGLCSFDLVEPALGNGSRRPLASRSPHSFRPRRSRHRDARYEEDCRAFDAQKVCLLER